MYRIREMICTHSNQLNHPCNQIIKLHMHRLYMTTLYLINHIKALSFHPTIHQDFDSISVLRCKCVIILRLRFTRIRLNPTWLTQLHYYRTYFGNKLSQ